MDLKAILGIGPLMLLSATALLGAQTSSTKPIALTGCLRVDRARTGDAAGTTGEPTFVIIDARPNTAATPGGASEEAKGTSDKRQRSAQNPYGSKGPWFLVKGDDKDLWSHVDQCVDVAGTLDTKGSILGTSASVTDGPSGTIHAVTVKEAGGSCGE